MACRGEAGPGARREGAVAAVATSGEENRAGEELLQQDCSGDQPARSCHCDECSWRGRGRVTVRGEVDDFGLAQRRQSRGGGGAEGMRSMAAPWPASAHGAGVWFERCKEARDP
ncbi:hypothetical protein VPH35_046929 [Triticum aestivum]